MAKKRGAGKAGPTVPEKRAPSELAHKTRPARVNVEKQADRIVLSRYAPAGMVITEDFDVVQLRGDTAPYIETASRALRKELLLPVRNALRKAKRTGTAVRKRTAPLTENQGARGLEFDVIPIKSAPENRHFLLLFQPSRQERNRKAAEEALDGSLSGELSATRQYLRSIIQEQETTNEELQVANEEILSSNEELRTINEELEKAKLEFLSTNEELTTINEGLRQRNAALRRINDDFNNLLTSADIPIVTLGADLRIRQFTPTAGRTLNLTPSDIGRPITDLQSTIPLHGLDKLSAQVVESLTARKREMQGRDGRRYTLIVRPYRTWENRIDGVVMILQEVDAERARSA